MPAVTRPTVPPLATAEVVTAAAVQEPPDAEALLAAGWFQVEDPGSGAYYIHRSGQISWEVPSLDTAVRPDSARDLDLERTTSGRRGSMTTRL